MKKTRFFLLTFFYFSLIFNLKSFAQKKVYTSTKSASGGWYIHASELKNTTLMVALDDENSLVSKKLIANIEAFWKFTPYEFIKTSEIDKYLNDPKYSVLFLGKYGSDKNSDGFAYGIILGDKKNKKIGDAKVVTSIPLPDSWSKKTGATLLDFKYLITFFVQTLQKDVSDTYEKKEHTIHRYKYSYYYDDGVNEIKDKKVLISKDALNPDFNKTNFLRNFGLKDEQVIIVEKEDIERALEKQDDKVAFIYDFTGKVGVIHSVKGATAIAYGSDHNMRLNAIYKYTASVAGLGVFIYIVKTKIMGNNE